MSLRSSLFEVLERIEEEGLIEIGFYQKSEFIAITDKGYDDICYTNPRMGGYIQQIGS